MELFMNNRRVKYIRRQDSGWKQASGCSGETSINLSNEIFDYLTFGIIDGGEECGITFKIFREDYVNALTFIESQLPLYRSTSKSSESINPNAPILKSLYDSICSFFEDQESVNYTVTLYCRKDGRIYLKGLKQKGFTIRNFLVEYASAIVFEMTDEGFNLRVISSVLEGDLD